ncbi:PREDICTED: uncharacterized protein LOC109463529 isoform X2 [Branchiostoma belcheri]|uniref:Uncharacterized protein LOC109463529 isoform X2 n=1 Tax=Branchiostoma belcheri TaxID=7741 RepID=A0A6P4XHD2_BRABE|nr:PREDICTED: uncharacterized protein LOC109463529 isoform X2 [Branchiostoma belcheri]
MKIKFFSPAFSVFFHINMAENADFSKLDSIASRKSGGENLYLRFYQAKMAQNPSAHRFSDPSLDEKEREALTRWNRDRDDRTSPLNLQLLFAFSVPSRQALDLIVGLKRPLVSVGAGVGYWEFLLQQTGCDVLAFDSNELYPEGLRYIDVKKGGPEVLVSHGERVLFLAWPDADGESIVLHIVYRLSEPLQRRRHHPCGRTVRRDSVVQSLGTVHVQRVSAQSG